MLSPDKPFFPNEMIDLLSLTIPAKMPVMITGQPGIGKTDVVHTAAFRCSYEIIVAHPVVDAPEDYKGMPVKLTLDDGTTIATFLPFDNLMTLMNAKAPVVYFLDDFGHAPNSVQAASMQLLLARAINNQKISDNVVFVAATNEKAHKAGVRGILEPVKDRFIMICEMTTGLNDWCKWAYDPKNNMPYELISFMRYRPKYLTEFEPSPIIKKTPTPRTIAGVGKLMKLGIPKPLELRTYCSAAGKEFATDFTGFLRVYRDLPNPDAVLADPKNADLPKEPSAKYAICGALSARATKDNMDAFTTYIDRLSEEFAVMAMRDALARDEELSKTKAFNLWITDHQDALL